jgi:Lon-like protease
VKRASLAAAVVGALGLGLAVLLWNLPADDFIFTPDRAQPLAQRVTVQNARPAGDESIYYVDVFVRRTSLLEEILPFTRPEGSTVVPEHAVLLPGTSDADRRRQNVADMTRSKRIASLVALRALGYDVKATPKGAIVVGVVAGSPAAGKLEQGDVIVGVDGGRIRTPDALRREIGRRRPGESVRLAVRREGKRIELTVGTIRSTDEEARPIVGIQVDQDADIVLPLRVDIDLGRVGGPSAGLPFALEIVRMLGRDVTHGCRIAATGELTLDGSVISVGALRQKTIGARRSDVDLFLVPAGPNAEEARESAEDVRIVPVESFQQALRSLQTAAVNC